MINKLRKGYTFLEFCIVMAVLLLISISIVPQFGQAAYDARMAQTEQLLKNVNEQIGFYKLDHDGQLPGGGKTTLEDALCGLTDKFGATYTEKLKNMGLRSYGPYLKNMPLNPLNEKNSIRINGPLAGANTHGWRFDSSTGLFESDFPINQFSMGVLK